MRVPAQEGPTGPIDVDRAEVLVVGGGPVGLAMAIDLGVGGVDVLVVDAGDGVVRYPAAESIDASTMEWMRRSGVSSAIERSGFPSDLPRDIAFVTRLNGYELARFDRPSNRDRHSSTAGLSPEAAVWWPKFWFDQALRDRASDLPNVTLRYQWRCVGIEQTDSGVTAHLQDSTGRTTSVDASYLVGCDGSRSLVRRECGIEFEGFAAEARWQGAFLEAPGLFEAIPFKPAVQYYVLRPRRTIFGSIDGAAHWRVTFPLGPDEAPDTERVEQVVRDAVGTPDVPLRLLDSRPWSGSSVVARSYRDRRVFLAGDAAHLMWPSGGHGMNTGVGDVANLGWKLALALAGKGSDVLLDSYHAERKPVGARNRDRAAANYRADVGLPAGPLLDDPGPDGARVRRDVAAQIVETREFEWRSLGIQLGYRYESAVVCAEDASGPPDDPSTYEPCLRAGHRAPHIVLPDGQALIDAAGNSFVVVVPDGHSSSAQAWMAACARRRLSVRVVTLPDTWSSHYGAEQVLIRPDGYVVWHGLLSASGGIQSVVDLALGLSAQRGPEVVSTAEVPAC